MVVGSRRDAAKLGGHAAVSRFIVGLRKEFDDE